MKFYNRLLSRIKAVAALYSDHYMKFTYHPRGFGVLGFWGFVVLCWCGVVLVLCCVGVVLVLVLGC